MLSYRAAFLDRRARARLFVLVLFDLRAVLRALFLAIIFSLLAVGLLSLYHPAGVI